MCAHWSGTSVRFIRTTLVWIAGALALFLQGDAVRSQTMPGASSGSASARALTIMPNEGERLLRYPSDAKPAGIYALERALTFNVLELLYYDPTAGRLALVGRYDERFQGDERQHPGIETRWAIRRDGR